MNRLALGTVQFGLAYGIANRQGQVARSEALAMLELAGRSGIDTLDTAIAYGESETCLGEANLENFKIITKLPGLPDACVDIDKWVNQQVEASLKRLGTSAVYGLLLHRPEQLLGTDGVKLYASLQKLKATGKIHKLGISVYSPEELTVLVKKFRFDLVQTPFNLIDRRLQTSGWLQNLQHENIEVHTRSSFLQGLLLMPISDIPPQFAKWTDLFTHWRQWLTLHDISPLQACLNFVLSFPEIDRVIVGADSLNQLAQIISAAEGKTAGILPPNLQCEDENLINPALWASK